MSTTERGTLKEFYQTVNAIHAAVPDIDLTLNRALLDQVHRVAAEPTGVTYENVDAGGRPGIWCLPADGDRSRVIVFLHGGGFVVQSVHSHRKLAGHLARAAGCRVLLLDYRQAPECPYPAPIDDVETTYRWLIDEGTQPASVAFAGDSAGACLAVSSVVRVRDSGMPLPAAVIGFSPWFDLECSGPSLTTNAATDVLVQQALVQEMAMAYLGGRTEAADPLANPLRADLTGFPPVLLTASADEALLDNGERFVERAREAGVDVDLRVTQGQQHVFQFEAGRSAEADRTIAEAGAWAADRLGVSAPARA